MKIYLISIIPLLINIICFLCAINLKSHVDFEGMFWVFLMYPYYIGDGFTIMYSSVVAFFCVLIGMKLKGVVGGISAIILNYLFALILSLAVYHLVGGI